MATRKKPPVSPAGGGPARGRAIQPAPLRRITPPAPAGTNACSVPVKYWKRRCRLCASYLGIPAAPHHRLQTAERAAAPTGLPDPESGRSTARRQKAADGAEAMAATEAADRLRTRAPRPGIGSLHGEETENGKRCGGNGSNRGSRSAAHPGTPGGGRSIVRIRNGVKIIPPAEKRSFFLIFAP